MGNLNVAQKAENNRSIRVFKNRLDSIVNGINDPMPKVIPYINDMRKLDKAFRNYGNRQLQNFKNKFKRNPNRWPRLSEAAQKIRRYKLNPNELKKDILNAGLWDEVETNQGDTIFVKTSLITKTAAKNTNVVDRLNRVIQSLPKIPVSTEANVRPNRPALLFTGRLMNSLSFEYRRSTRKGKKKVTYIRSFKYNVGAKYGEIHFLGGSMRGFRLIIRRRGERDRRRVFKYKFLIPNEYARYFRGLDLGEDYEVSLETKMTKVEERDPFILTRKDEQDLRDFQESIRVPLEELLDDFMGDIKNWQKERRK